MLRQSIGDCHPVWIDEQGRVFTPAHAPPARRPAPSAALRWSVDPLTWSEPRRMGPKARATARRLLDSGRALLSTPAAATRPETPAGYMMRAPTLETVPLYLAVHPVTGDQLLSTDVSEAGSLGYEQVGVVGYLLARAPVTGKLGPTRPAAPWAARFGLAALAEPRAADGQPDPRIQVRPAPPVTAAKRDPSDVMKLVDDFETLAVRTRREPTPPHASKLAQEVSAAAWYHTIELPGGITTHGEFDHRPVLPYYGIPADLSGQRCLDIACSDGFFAFEFERRGGEVTAINVDSLADWDLPTGAVVPTRLTERPIDRFALAHEALGSTVRRVARNVYDLDPADLGTFDFVHSGDVLLHLERPLEALRRARAMTADDGMALIVDSISMDLEGTVTRYFGAFVDHLWWLPSLDCLVQMVYDAGFGSAEVLNLYHLPAWDGPLGSWRAVITARPS